MKKGKPKMRTLSEPSESFYSERSIDGVLSSIEEVMQAYVLKIKVARRDKSGKDQVIACELLYGILEIIYQVAK